MQAPRQAAIVYLLPYNSGNMEDPTKRPAAHTTQRNTPRMATTSTPTQEHNAAKQIQLEISLEDPTVEPVWWDWGRHYKSTKISSFP